MSRPDHVPPSLASATDAELAARITAGGARDEEAELCRRFAPRIRSYGRRHLDGDDAATELVQRVLLRTLEKLRAGAVREPERIASFILGTARLVAHELRRTAARAVALPEDELVADVANAGDPIAADHVARLLQTLPPREQTVLTLTFYGEQTADAIGEALGVSAGNVRVIRHRAMARLRDAFASERSA